MKRILAILLSLVLIMSFFTSCKKNDKETTTKESTTVSKTTTTTETKSKTEEKIEAEESTKSIDGTTATVTTSNTATTNKSGHTHSYTKVKTVTADCTNGGYELWKCSCGAEEKRNATNALGHDYFYNIHSGDKSREPKNYTDTAANIANYHYGYCSRCGAKDPEYAYCEELVAQGLAYIKNEKGLQIDSSVAMDNRRDDFCPYYSGNINNLKAWIDDCIEMNTPKYMNLYIYPDINSNHWSIGICAHM